MKVKIFYNNNEKSIEVYEKLAKKLENELIVNYDLNILKQEFEDSILSEDFYNTIKNVLNVKLVFSNSTQ